MATNVPENKRIYSVVSESLAIVTWLWITTKLLVVDLDWMLVSRYAPEFETWYPYRGIIVLCAVALSWVAMGHARALRLMSFVLFYPFVVAWRGIVVLSLHWPITLAFFPVVNELHRRLKSTLAMYSLAILAAVSILLSRNSVVLSASIAILCAVLAVHLFRGVSGAYQTGAFAGLGKLARSMQAKLEGEWLPKFAAAQERAPKPDLAPNAPAEDPRFAAMLVLYSCNWGFELLASKLRNVAKSRLPEIYLLLSWLYTALLCALVFAFGYLGAYKLDAASFSNVGENPFASFLGLSISRLTVAGISTVVPTSSLALTLSYSQAVTQFALIVIFCFSIFTARREKYNADIAEFVEELRGSAIAAEKHLLSFYELTMGSVEVLLVVKQPAIINWMRKMRNLPELRLAGEKDSKAAP